MADQKISNLAAVAVIGATDLFHNVEGAATNKKITGANMKIQLGAPDVANTWLEQQTFTALPTGAGVGDGSLYINPASANADHTLLGLGVAGAFKARISGNGNIVTAGRLYVNRIHPYSSNLILESTTSDLRVNQLVGGQVQMGLGVLGQITLTAHLDGDGILFKRDVDGVAGTYNEAGSVLVIQRDVTNPGSENGNFLEMQNAAGTPLAKFDKDGDLFCKQVAAGDGGVTNYLGIGTDGTLTLYGTARKTKHAVISNADLGKGATAASQVIVGDYTVWEFGIGDDAVTDWEVPEDWATGTDILVSVHWQVNEAYVTNSGEVQWEVTWAATPHNETEPLDGPTHTGTLDSGDQNIPATARYLTATDIGTISGASLTVGDAVGLTLKRVALDGGANPAAEPGVCHFEMHYTIDSFGE